VWVLEYVRLGRRGPRVSIVGVGTLQAGGRLWLSVDTCSLEAAVLRAVGAGVNLFDTAELYGLGRAEERLGAILRRAGLLDSVVIVDKVAGYRVTWSGFRKAVERMARRLGRRPDVILYHWPPPYPFTVCRVARLLERLVDEGYTGWVGFSNFNGRMIVRAVECMARHEPVTVQVHYSLAHRSPERSVFPQARRYGLTVTAWGPLAKGALAGKTRPDNPARLTDPVFLRAARDRKLQQALETLAGKYGAPRAAIALAWIIAHGAIPIVGVRRPEHVDALVRAAAVRLAGEDVELLDRLTAKYVGRRYSELEWNRLIPPPLQMLIYEVLLRGI
jgi:aryl-alcohol dehydrogenase-like predicted oxidoreductase